MATKNYEGILFIEGIPERTVDPLTEEAAIQININERPFTVSMRTPGEDKAMVRGLLHAEDIIRDIKFHPEMSILEENQNGIVRVVNCSIPIDKLGEGYSNSRSLLSVSSCGICGKTELSDLTFEGERIQENEPLNIEAIKGLFDRMRESQLQFERSGGSHAAAAFSESGEILCSMEDIGRHNAVDKVVGQLLLDGNLSKARIMTVSGRISYEIVIKCFKARIPILAAVSAPSSLAVDFAKELGLTLLAFSRGVRTTCYAHPERIQRTENMNSKAS
ncbi:MAG: formate dehydrogenase accessory sulfurtransferase FdhD [Bacteroidota bacterium]|nr:formate dehydrogenase accessory sulfurtransferase FdhD [Bacteroidota bacterium]